MLNGSLSSSQLLMLRWRRKCFIVKHTPFSKHTCSSFVNSQKNPPYWNGLKGRENFFIWGHLLELKHWPDAKAWPSSAWTRYLWSRFHYWRSIAKTNFPRWKTTRLDCTLGHLNAFPQCCKSYFFLEDLEQQFRPFTNDFNDPPPLSINSLLPLMSLKDQCNPKKKHVPLRNYSCVSSLVMMLLFHRPILFAQLCVSASSCAVSRCIDVYGMAVGVLWVSS